MEHINDKTANVDFSKIHIPNGYKEYVYKAIVSSAKLLTMKEFNDINNFDTNDNPFDINEDSPIYIDEIILNWLGYEGDTINKKMKNCKKKLQTYFDKDVEYKILKNNEYKEFLDEEPNKSNFPEPAEGPYANTIKHIIVMPDAFKSLCLMNNTKKGMQIRKYYNMLHKLSAAYISYQNMFSYQESVRAMNK